MPLLQCLERVLKDMDYEVVIVDDDSPDGTAAMARSIAQSNARVRVIQRIGRRGLASAAVEGMLATSSPYLLVMDADLQHDEQIIPAMLEKMKQQNLAWPELNAAEMADLITYLNSRLVPRIAR